MVCSMSDAEWKPDPSLPGRNRYWNGSRWTSNVADVGGEPYEEPYLGAGGERWQYGVINIGVFNAMDRMQVAFGALGSEGWELITIYDKASNWLSGSEKGFMLFKRAVPPGQRLPEDQWCITLRL